LKLNQINILVRPATFYDSTYKSSEQRDAHLGKVMTFNAEHLPKMNILSLQGLKSDNEYTRLLSTIRDTACSVEQRLNITKHKDPWGQWKEWFQVKLT